MSRPIVWSDLCVLLKPQRPPNLAQMRVWCEIYRGKTGEAAFWGSLVALFYLPLLGLLRIMQKFLKVRQPHKLCWVKRITHFLALCDRLSVSRVFDVTAYYKSRIQSEFSPACGCVLDMCMAF